MQYLFVTALPKYFSRLIAYVYDYGRDMVSSAALIHFILAENRVFFFLPFMVLGFCPAR